MDFPIFQTKVKGITRKFDLNNPKERKEYFELKAGKEIKKIRQYLGKGNTFIAYLLGKKNSGKGTYAKMFAETVDPEKVDHFSIGDMIRGIDKELAEPERKKELIKFLEKNYRGRLSLDEIIHDLENRDTKTLRPTELILALAKREIEKRKKKALFIDGFPRDLDQMNSALFFRDLIGYRDDPDILVLIDLPESVIDARMKWRKVCPECQTSRNLKLLPTSKIEYDETKKEFNLICDNPNCKGAKMLPKEGDEFGIEPIKERLQKDAELMEKAFSLYGIPKVFLRNSIPANIAKEYVDEYEITPEYDYEWDPQNKKAPHQNKFSTGQIKITEKPWVIPDDKGVPSVSLLAAPVAVSLIKQMANILCP